jgi:hypothetical protein
MTPSRSSALRASDDATRIVIPPAPSGFYEGRPAPSPHAAPAAAGISPSFSVPSAFLCALCVKTFASLRALCLPNPQFLFDTNKPFAFITTFSARRKQSTSFFLFDTNERLGITDQQSLIINIVTRTGKIACATKG